MVISRVRVCLVEASLYVTFTKYQGPAVHRVDNYTKEDILVFENEREDLP